MDADFSIELSQEDPVLDFPWKDPAGKLAYVDLKRHPELLPKIEEAVKFPELGEFLRTLNSPQHTGNSKVRCLGDNRDKRGRRNLQCVAQVRELRGCSIF